MPVISLEGPQGPLEAVMNAVIGTVDGFPFINADNLVLAMTSDNQGTGDCQFYNPYLTRAPDDPLTGAALTNSEELLRWLEVPMNKAQRSETFLTSADVVFAGDLFELGGRTVAMAIGAQYREEGRETEVNPQTLGSVNSFGQLSGGESVAGLSENRNFDADRDIYAAFLELQIPVLDTVDVQLAARYEDYGSEIGDTFDPKLGVRWEALPSLVMRGSWSSSFRGPSLAQIEEGTGFSLELGVRDVLGQRGVGDPVGAVNVNWINEYQVSDFPVGQPDFDAAGHTNRDPEKRLARSMPDLKGNVGLSWMRSEHAAQIVMRYVGAYEDNAVPSQRLEDEFDPYYAFDARYSYMFDFYDTSIELTIGALDLFDADLPRVRDFSGVDLSVFDQRGRRVYAGFTMRL